MRVDLQASIKAYIALPILTVLLDSYASYVILAIVCLTRIPLGATGVFPQASDPMMVVPLYAIGAARALEWKKEYRFRDYIMNLSHISMGRDGL